MRFHTLFIDHTERRSYERCTQVDTFHFVRQFLHLWVFARVYVLRVDSVGFVNEERNDRKAVLDLKGDFRIGNGFDRRPASSDEEELLGREEGESVERKEDALGEKMTIDGDSGT